MGENRSASACDINKAMRTPLLLPFHSLQLSDRKEKRQTSGLQEKAGTPTTGLKSLQGSFSLM